MTEYIVEVPDEEAELFIARFGINGTTMFGYQLVDEIVRCRDCKHFEPRGLNGVCHRSKFLPIYAEPDGFCAWPEKRTDE